MRVIIVWKMPYWVTQNLDSDFVPIEGCKNGCLTFFFLRFGFEIVYLYLDNNPPKVKIWEKYKLVANYSRDLIA